MKYVLWCTRAFDGASHEVADPVHYGFANDVRCVALHGREILRIYSGSMRRSFAAVPTMPPKRHWQGVVRSSTCASDVSTRYASQALGSHGHYVQCRCCCPRRATDTNLHLPCSFTVSLQPASMRSPYRQVNLLQRLNQDVLLEIFEELQHTKDLGPLPLTCKWLRDSCNSVLFSRTFVRSTFLHRSFHDVFPAQSIWPYVR
ncbi:hypothetical protein OH77DRAFT_1076604 [Trametes cingulata]|nr:hypothetical protein OH77DRAFT_1076604 [Trametes cingulata]